MTICVVIATFNRAAHLDACLARLSGQAFEPGDQIRIVDNGSDDSTGEVLEGWARKLPGRLRVYEERRPGKSIAIATALRGCRADVLALTDDDVAVSDEWISSIRRAFEDPRVALVGGRVLPDFEGAVPSWLQLAHGGAGFGRMGSPLALLDYGDRPQPLGERAAIGANLAVRRDAFERVGGFPTRLGKLRGTLLSGEDHQLCERVQLAGLPAMYDPSLSVRHFVPSGRLRVRYFLRWFFWSGVTHAVMDRSRGAAEAPRRLFGIPAYLLKQFVVEALAVPRSLLRGARREAAEHSTLAAFAAGYSWAAWRSRFEPHAVAEVGQGVEAA